MRENGYAKFDDGHEGDDEDDEDDDDDDIITLCIESFFNSKHLSYLGQL